jgi:uncharacterized lipoprotein YehR (DUF1307 family)
VEKLFSLFLIILISASLTGCSSSTKTKTFTLEKNGVKLKLVYVYKDDKVIKQTANNTIPYAALKVTTKEEAKTLLDPISEQYQGKNGVVETLKYGSDGVVETLSIDYTKADLNELANIPGMIIDEQALKNGAISMEASQKLLLKKGFELK